jgi:transcriptional regulator with XRE-family HTH domain
MAPLKISPILGERFRRNLKKYREKQKLSVGGFASIAGVSRQYVYMLESGERAPSLDVVELFARALDVDPSALLREA